MTDSKNVQIPYELFSQIMGFFCYLSISSYRFPCIYDFDSMHSGLRRKQLQINLRTAYTKVARASDQDQKDIAMANYLSLKRKTQSSIYD